ncbi:MAG TPA: SRPBCC family protein [Gammaproteobacteria bacterium]|nr:SRPBCC family protein [Gammaproteobacteria bacterium]
MTEVHVRETIDAPAARVWEMIGDFGGLARIGLVPSCTVEGEGIGAVRTLDMGGPVVRERLEAHDDAGRTLTYTMVETGPLPVRNYRSTIRVLEEGPQRCTIDWAGEFDPLGDAAEQAEQTVRGIYTGGISGLRKALGLQAD